MGESNVCDGPYCGGLYLGLPGMERCGTCGRAKPVSREIVAPTDFLAAEIEQTYGPPPKEPQNT